MTAESPPGIVTLHCSMEINGRVCSARQHVPREMWLAHTPDFQDHLKQSLKRGLIEMVAEELDLTVHVSGDGPNLDEFLAELLDDACE